MKRQLVVDFGWFEWREGRARFKGSGVALPCAYHRLDRPSQGNGMKWEYEGVFPLENTLTAHLFGEQREFWEVRMALYVPCPIHRIGEVDPYRCAMQAYWKDNSYTVTNPPGCAGFACAGCTHMFDEQLVQSDPGDADEFFETLRHWGGLNYEPQEVPEHNDVLAQYAKTGVYWELDS